MHLLIIEDEESHRELVIHALGKALMSHFTWDIVATLAEARSALDRISYNVILTDLSLPDSPLDKTLASILEYAGKTPVIVLTSLNDPESILKMIQNGAKDCIPKQAMGSHVLERAITYCIDRERLQADLLQRNIQLNGELIFRRLFNTSKIGFIIFNQTGHILKANPAFANWIGYDQEDLKNRDILELTHPGCRELSRSNWEKILLEDRDEILFEKTYIHKNGKYLYGEVILQTIEWESGISYIFASVSDLSAHRETEEVLKQARNKAESALKSKASLLSMMSHDIRAPIASIVGMADYLAHANIPDEEQECIDVIKRSGKNLLSMIEGILELSKLEAGKFKIFNKPTDILQLLENAGKVFEREANEKGIQLDIVSHLVDSHPLMDEARLNQILLNLIGNAVKFTGPDGTICIRVIQEPSHWKFQVEDSGIGISPEDQPRLFKAFSQANDQILRNYGGTGLGLSICKGLCEAMGGSITVESELGKGSVFTVELPVHATGSLKN